MIGWIVGAVAAAALAITLNAFAIPLTAGNAAAVVIFSISAFVACVVAAVSTASTRPSLARARIPLIVILAATFVYALVIFGLGFAAPDVPLYAWLMLIAAQLIVAAWAYFFVGFIVRNSSSGAGRSDTKQ